MGTHPIERGLAPLQAAPWLMRWDPRARIASLTLLALAIAAAQTVLGAALGLVAVSLLYALGGLGLHEALRRLRWIALFLLPIALLVPWRQAGDPTPLLDGWMWGPKLGGSVLALRLCLRALGAGAAAVLALALGPFGETAEGLRGLGVPNRLVHMLHMSYRYLFVLRGELERVRAALAARGFVPKTDRRTAAVYGRVSAALLVRSIARTERIDQAMRCRGFTGVLRSRKRLRLSGADLVRAFCVVGLAALVLIVDRGGWRP